MYTQISPFCMLNHNFYETLACSYINGREKWHFWKISEALQTAYVFILAISLVGVYLHNAGCSQRLSAKMFLAIEFCYSERLYRAHVNYTRAQVNTAQCGHTIPRIHGCTSKFPDR